MAKRMVTMRLEERIDNMITSMAREQDTSKAAIVEAAIEMAAANNNGTDAAFSLAYPILMDLLKVLAIELAKIEPNITDNDQTATSIAKLIDEYDQNRSNHKRWGRPDIEREAETKIDKSVLGGNVTRVAKLRCGEVHFTTPINSELAKSLPSLGQSRGRGGKRGYKKSSESVEGQEPNSSDVPTSNAPTR